MRIARHLTNEFAVRETFSFGGNINWFPGHMRKAAKKMVSDFKDVDMVLEVRDARIPLSSSNFMFDEILINKPRLVIFNKSDLAEKDNEEKIKKIFRNNGQDILFTSVIDNINIEKLVPQITSMVAPQFKSLGVMFLIMGIPNVGKSTIINTLRRSSNKQNLGQIKKTKVSKVGNEPGVTRNLQPFLVNKDPLIYLVDSPGVMMPKISSSETGLKLALTGAIKSHLVGFEILADYALFLLNQKNNFAYVDVLKLDEATDNIDDVYDKLALLYGDNRESASQRIVSLFRSGQFGRLTLDDFNDIILDDNKSKRPNMILEHKRKTDASIINRRSAGISIIKKKGGSIPLKGR